MPTVNEALRDDAIAHAVDMQHYSANVLRRIIALLNRTDADIAAQIAAALDAGPPGASVQRLDALLDSVRGLNAQAYAAVSDALQREVQSLAGYEAERQIEAWRSALDDAGAPVVVGAQAGATIAIALTAVPPATAYAAAMSRPFQGRLLSEWMQTLESDRAARIRDTVRMGYLEGQTTDQIVRRVRGTRAGKYADGILQIDRRNAEAVVRTALSHTAATARSLVTEANADLISDLVWAATLDTRTSHECFPSDTIALPVGDLRGVVRRPWNGDLVVITTASGKKLRATPNHPVLTARGWRPMQEVEPGADVLYRVGVDVGGVSAAEDVEVPATMGAVFDALNKPAFGDVFVECTSEVDFHGDGVRGEHEINHPRTQGHLRLGIETAFGQEVAEKLLVLVAQPAFLFREGQVDEFLFGPPLIDVAPQVNTGSAKDRIKSRLADLLFAANVGRSSAVKEESNQFGFVGALPELASADTCHNTGPLEDASDCGGRNTVTAGDLGGRNAIGVVADDVVSVEREFFTGHVFNLQTGTELYIADGFVVHNCRVRDGKRYTVDAKHKPIGHDLPWLGGPGRAHWNCRSVEVHTIKAWDELGITMPPATRASMDGQVPAETTYAEWLARQPMDRIEEVLGPSRAKLFKEGGLPLDKFSARDGHYLTLDELRKRDAEAFKRAGLAA